MRVTAILRDVTTRTYFIRTFGCQMNEHDSERAAGVLETMGYRRAPDEASADLVLFNTCAIRENADNKLYGQLSQLKPLKLADPDKTIVVGGCLAQKDQQGLAERVPWVDVVYGTHNAGNLPRLLAQADSTALPVVEILEHTEMFPSALPARREVRHHAWVSISIGCNNTCTFCIVPKRRGPERSRKLTEVTTPKQPKLPVASLVRSYPATFFTTRPPARTIRPCRKMSTRAASRSRTAASRAAIRTATPAAARLASLPRKSRRATASSPHNVSSSSNTDTVVRLDDLEVGALVTRPNLGDAAAAGRVNRGVQPGVQEGVVALVDVAFHRLDPITRLDSLPVEALIVVDVQELELGNRGRRVLRPHVRPDHVVALDARIGHGAHLRLERALLGLARHVDARALAVELPAVVHAADPFALVAPEEERGAAMRAVVLDQPDPTRRDAERDEVLAEQTHAHRRAVGLGELGGEQRGNPVLADEVARGCPGSDAAEEVVLGGGEHRGPSLAAY